jgi:sRNA-binding protein
MTSTPDTEKTDAEKTSVDKTSADKTSADRASADKTSATKTHKPSRRPDAMPVLEQLAALYPQLFGAVFLPLKRGIFQDLLLAHPDLFDQAALKAALSVHTRSTRYLVAVADGRQRHDLTGAAVEAMAPEHVHHALLEVFRRRQARSKEDLAPTLRRRMLQAFERSGLSHEAYTMLVQGRDTQANAMLAEALQEARGNEAKDEALLRAFESGASTVQAFADMYGLSARSVEQALARARQVRARVAATAA